MSRGEIADYIRSLPVGSAAARGTGPVGAISPTEFPKGVVTGSNLIEFEESVSSPLRSAVSLSLLAAQRVAANDEVVQTPDQWMDRHNTVLQNLNWLVERGGTVESTFDSANVAVHRAIIPFITSALGGVATAASLIITALQQLGEMDKNAPWITLFDRESRRFEVTEYQFTYVSSQQDQTLVKMAAARLDAEYGRTQVLFVKLRDQDARFQAVRSTMRADANLLKGIEQPLRDKLGGLAGDYIQELELDI